MKNHLLKRILSMLLAVALVIGLVPSVSAAPGSSISWKETDREISTDLSNHLVEDTTEESTYTSTDLVRVSIVLDDPSTLQSGYSTMGIASNQEAMAYNRSLQEKQVDLAKTISAQALNGKKLDVVWNLTLVGNIISANVPYGRIESIEAIDGVKEICLETQYEAPVTTKSDDAQTQSATSGIMVGANPVWASGYTGAGSRIAIIDTGSDTDHQSLDNGAFLYALQQNAAAAGMSYEAYVASLDLLDVEEINSVLTSLNAYKRYPGITAEDLYLNEKLSFAFNYVDKSLNVTHDNDYQGEHGSHVAGIATANRYIPDGSGYVESSDSVFVTGVAPDAQLITMKVFGLKGTSDSDYMAAIEDAILLGCDSVNLSLGTSVAGSPYNDVYSELLDFLTQTDTVVVISAGNAGTWADESIFSYLYSDDTSLDTVGAPGSYTNALTVASVENDGSIGYSFTAESVEVFYNEYIGYGNSAMSGLDTSANGTGTDYEYVFVDGLGLRSDYEGIDLTGKVVFCSRGTTNFADKANIAVSLGAAAVVIYNNTSGIITLNLSGYSYSAPCVSILQSEGAAIRAASTKQTTDAGLEYYTGTMTIFSKMGATVYGSEYYTMSSFSSWGVPGDLSLKPEITAPGGSIRSIYGSTPSGGGSDQYEVMSGTSMAAPQVTGMIALLAQYIREQDLEARTGLSARQLAQSLLMSTAVPMFEEASGGNYYSLLTQGSGLARVDLAASAESYILVEGQDDGKVKVELGDDPQRTGVYEFSFSINNLTDKVQSYALDADMFRQDVFEYMEGAGVYMLDTWTADLPCVATFTSNDTAILKQNEEVDYDLNGDGTTDALDADFLLEYLLGNETELKANGDVDRNGQLSTYDAHLLLSLLEGNSCVTVPAGSSVSIDVTLALTEDAKSLLDAANKNGTYVEAFVYARALADEEGAVGTTHSIPVLGFYGGWTESTMYDQGSYVEYLYNTGNHIPYLYYIQGTYGNSLTVTYGDGYEYYFSGNPIAEDASYLPERNAMNNQNGTALVRQLFALIRSAEDAKLLITDADTGAVYYEKSLGALDPAYYYTNGGYWDNTQQSVYMNWAGTDTDGNALPEGTTVDISLIAAPAYYRSEDGTYDFDALGKGAYLTTRMSIDNTAPEATSIMLDLMQENVLRITALDNRYVAAAALLNASGTTMLASASPNQTEAGVEAVVELDISGISGDKFLVAVFDYAQNYTVYEVQLGLDDVDRPYFTAIDYSNWQFVGLDHEANMSYLAEHTQFGTPYARAAEYVDGYVFSITADNKLYVTNDSDLTDTRLITALDPDNEWEITGFNDIAYNYADEKLYGQFYSDLNYEEAPVLCTIDMFTGSLDVLCVLPEDVNTMAIDGDGNFYSAGYYSASLYTYTLEDVMSDYPSMTYVGEMGYYGTGNTSSMAWDHNTDELYWAFPDTLLRIDPETAEPTNLGYFTTSEGSMGGRLVGLYIRPNSGSSRFDPTDVVADLTLDTTDTRVLKGHTVELTATVWPWNISDSSVTWSSSNTDVATINENGVVTGISVGTTVITATSNLDSTKSVSCNVEVFTLEKTLNGIVWDENGQIWWSEFSINDLSNYTKLTTEPADVDLASTVITADGTLYAASLDPSDDSSVLYTVNPKTFETTQIGSSAIGFMDLSYAPYMNGGSLMAVYGGNLLCIDPSSAQYVNYWNLWYYNLVGITYMGSTQYQEWGFDTWIEWYFLIDTEGYVYLLGFLEQDGAYYYIEHPAAPDGLFTMLDFTVDTYRFCSAHFDGEMLYFSAFNQAYDHVTLLAVDVIGSGNAYTLGTFPESVWPVGGLCELSDAVVSTALTDVELNAAPKALDTPSTTSLELLPMDEDAVSTAALADVPVVAPQSTAEATADSKRVTVEVTIPVDASNGRLSVTFDASKLAVASVTGATEAFAYTTGEGVMEIAYACADTIAADSTVAYVTFDVLTSGDQNITVTHDELGKGSSAESEDLTVHTCPSAAFQDVNQNAWYHEAVDYVVSEGLMNGVETDTFDPYGTLTRAQLVTVLYRLAGSPAVESDEPFNDVTDGKYYSDAVAWAYANGITKGTSAELFEPYTPVSRQQMVTFFARYAAWSGMDVEAKGDLSAFTDANTVSDYALESMIWAVENGLIKGVSTTELDPTANTQRVQFAAVLMRYDALEG